jgi:hypothetical protein
MIFNKNHNQIHQNHLPKNNLKLHLNNDKYSNYYTIYFYFTILFIDVN